MIWFLDSSVLVKRFVAEPDRGVVVPLFAGSRRLATSSLAAIEVRSAFFRRVDRGLLDQARALALAAELDEDLAEMILVEPRARTLRLASRCVERHRLRAYDAVQLASALTVRGREGCAVTFGCMDRALRTAAVAEGLRVFPG